MLVDQKLWQVEVGDSLTKTKIAKKKKYCFFGLFEFWLEKVE